MCLLLIHWMCLCLCVFEREREKERNWEERQKELEKEREWEKQEREREWEGNISLLKGEKWKTLLKNSNLHKKDLFLIPYSRHVPFLKRLLILIVCGGGEIIYFREPDGTMDTPHVSTWSQFISFCLVYSLTFLYIFQDQPVTTREKIYIGAASVLSRRQRQEVVQDNILYIEHPIFSCFS